jgi:predicted  nucleic acid-binding Zn-ribbon protein
MRCFSMASLQNCLNHCIFNNTKKEFTMSQHEPQGEKLAQAYQQMMTRVKTAMEEARRDTLPGLQQFIDEAVEKAVALGELSREEAERIGRYLRRDVEDAAEFLDRREVDDDLSAWMRFDLELIEDRILALFQPMVDHTRAELEHLAARAEAMNTWFSGEITGPGTLQCKQCGALLHFHKPKAISPCPVCHHQEFARVNEAGEAAENGADASDNAA